MKLMKKLTSLMLALAFAVGMIPMTTLDTAAATYDTTLSFDEFIVQNLENFETTIDATSYCLANGWDEKQLATEFKRIVTENPALFYVQNIGTLCKTKYTYTKKNGVVMPETRKYTISSIKYTIKKSEFAAKNKKFLAAADKALAQINDSMTDLQKALVLHDYLVLNNAYDTSLTRYTAYDALVDGTSVCQGYAMAYSYLMQQAGIECTMIVSDKMSHAWNYVKIDGKWFHVDVTSDDPLYNGKYDLHGRVDHKYFMLSDNAIKKLGHNNWDTAGLPAAKTATYNNYFWKDVQTSIVNIGADWFWFEMDETSPAYNKNYEKLSSGDEFNNNFFRMYSLLKTYNFDTKKTKTLYKLDSTWYTNGSENTKSKSWVEASYTSIAAYNGLLYFNSNKKIMSIKPDGTGLKTVSSPKLSGTYLFGLTMNDNKISYTVKEKVATGDTLKTKTVTAATSTDIALSKTKASIKTGKTTTLKTTLTPDTSTDYITWYSDDKAVATVTSAGKVTGVSAGSCTVYALTATGKRASCKITVT